MGVRHSRLRRVVHELADTGRIALRTDRSRHIAVEAKRVSTYGGP